ncbi:MAG: hypothetical protein ACRD51_05650 [Candidatus Acidiferrum sp.]
MATSKAAGHTQKGLWGGILVALGLAGLLADFAFLAQPAERLIEKLRDGLFGIVPTLGLTVLNTARAILLHQVDYFSLVSRILVLCSAIAAIVVGATLWNARPAPMAASARQNLHGSIEGDR